MKNAEALINLFDLVKQKEKLRFYDSTNKVVLPQVCPELSQSSQHLEHIIILLVHTLSVNEAVVHLKLEKVRQTINS